MVWEPGKTGPTQLPVWDSLDQARKDMALTTLRDLFETDPDRAATFTFAACDLVVDFSKNLITLPILDLLCVVAQEMNLAAHRAAMFQGARINTTEDRSVLHTVLRAPSAEALVVEGVDVVTEVHEVLARMHEFALAVRDGSWLGHSGERIRSVVNIGIGGSDLGPVMAYEALRFYSDRDIQFRFVSNIDSSDLYEALRGLDPASTLFIVSSKTFTTLETMSNAEAARDWLLEHYEDPAAVRQHFVAVSANAEKVSEFGINTTHMFGFWDWVGGRYSMDSAIGLSTMIAIGPTNFADLLSGFHAMDEHFLGAPMRENIPIIHGLLSVWYRNFFQCQTHAILPYSQYLHRFPAYLQQLTMESNGKSVTLDGTPVTTDTGPIFWGEPGTNGQHSFYQLLHQGTSLVPVDFIGFAHSLTPIRNHQDFLMSNVFAQSQALAFGKTAGELAEDGVPAALIPHRVMPGNRPSTVILTPRLTPFALGSLIAMYEHSVFVQGCIWNINSFDQWGVELGKVMAQEIIPELTLQEKPVLSHDASTNALITHYRNMKET